MIYKESQDIKETQIAELKLLWHQLYHSESFDKENAFPILRELAPVAISIICMVADQPDIILREIGEKLGLPKTTLTGLINRLEQRGFLNRIVSKRDRRSYGLELTELGYQVQREQQAFEQKLWKSILGAFDTEVEREQFLMLFRKVVDNLQQFPAGLHASAGLLIEEQ